MARHGIGGRTVEDVQENLTVDEFQSWQLYDAETGGLGTLERIETLLAHLLAVTINVNTKERHNKVKASDLLPFAEKQDKIFGENDDWDNLAE